MMAVGSNYNSFVKLAQTAEDAVAQEVPSDKADLRKAWDRVSRTVYAAYHSCDIASTLSPSFFVFILSVCTNHRRD